MLPLYMSYIQKHVINIAVFPMEKKSCLITYPSNVLHFFLITEQYMQFIPFSRNGYPAIPQKNLQ